MSEKSRGIGRWTKNERPYRVPGDSRLRSDQREPLFVTSGYLVGHFRTRVYVGRFALRPTRYFRRSKFPSDHIAVSDLPTRLRSRKCALARVKKEHSEGYNPLAHKHLTQNAVREYRGVNV